LKKFKRILLTVLTLALIMGAFPALNLHAMTVDPYMPLTTTEADVTADENIEKKDPPPVGAPSPYLPLWEHTPDGKPRLFQDPDDPTGTKKRVYLIASHDVKRQGYCGPDIRVWSAPINDLNAWRDEGPVFTSYNEIWDMWDLMFAPDMVEVKTYDPTSPKAKGDGNVYEYYLYPHNISDDILSVFGYRMNMVAKSDRPDGPFEVVNWIDPNNRRLHTKGYIGFDPGVFVDYDDNGAVKAAYAYWGIDTSYAVELDPDTMSTPKHHSQSKYNKEKYVPETYAALTAAIADAKTVYNNPAATQAQIDAEAIKIFENILGLQNAYLLRPDTDPLRAALVICDEIVYTYSGRYTAASLTMLRAAMTTGTSRVTSENSANQDQMNTALLGIVDAVKGLEQETAVPLNKYILDVAIKRAEAISDTRPCSFMIPSTSTADNRLTLDDYIFVHPRAKEGRTLAQVRTAFGHFEASTIRQVGNKYVMVYSRRSGPEYGMGNHNGTLGYAFGDTPMGPWVDGGGCSNFL